MWVAIALLVAFAIYTIYAGFGGPDPEEPENLASEPDVTLEQEGAR